MANQTGKAARRAHGNRHACKRSKAKPTEAKYAAKRARWAAAEKQRAA